MSAIDNISEVPAIAWTYRFDTNVYVGYYVTVIDYKRVRNHIIKQTSVTRLLHFAAVSLSSEVRVSAA